MSAKIPSILVLIDGKCLKAMIDSGCSRSIISTEVPVDSKQRYTVNENVVTMNGTLVECQDACTVHVIFENRKVLLNCIISKIVPGYDILLGMDFIDAVGGVMIIEGEARFPNMNKICSKELELALSAIEKDKTDLPSVKIDDVDFTAVFQDGKWVVKWKHTNDPRLSNKRCHYKIPNEAKEKYCEEVNEWIKLGWLQEYNEEYDAIIPMMAVIQENKGKVRPVLDFRELNEFVSSHTADSAVCNEKLRAWRKLGNNLSIIDLKKAYLQIHVHPELWKYQVIKYNGITYCLTRLGFGLSVAPRIMTKILEYVLSFDKQVDGGTDSYIDDIIVNNDKVRNDKVLHVLKQFGLEAKPPEALCGARVLGLKLQSNEGRLCWKRDNDISCFDAVKSKRDLFSLCGKLTGHFPVCGWLRPVCSFLKRAGSVGSWDDPLSETVLSMVDDVRLRIDQVDPVKGVWSVTDDKETVGVVWCDASSIATGVALELGGEIVEDGCWLRKPKDVGHINLSELESVIKGLNLALKWKVKTLNIMTDSYTVNQWLASILSGDKRIRTKGLGEALVHRRLTMIKEIINEYDMNVTVKWVKSVENKADVLTRVPQKWLKSKICAASVHNNPVISDSEIKNVHEECHLGVQRTKYLAERNYPDAVISRESVENVVRNCKNCNQIDPQPSKWSHGSLDHPENWTRIAIDTTHYNENIFLTCVDCGPSRFAIWRKIVKENSADVVKELQQICLERGPPQEILLDNATIFRSDEFKRFAELWKIELVYRCAHRPAGNGIVERNHRTVKRMAARSNRSVLEMVRYYNLTPAKNQSKSPSEQIFEYNWRYPIKFEVKKDFHVENPYKVGDQVFVKPSNANCSMKWNSGVVSKVLSDHSVEINGFPRHVADVRKAPCSVTQFYSPTCDLEVKSGTDTVVVYPEHSSMTESEIENVFEVDRDEDLSIASSRSTEVGETSQSDTLVSDDFHGSCRPKRNRKLPKYFEEFQL